MHAENVRHNAQADPMKRMTAQTCAEKKLERILTRTDDRIREQGLNWKLNTGLRIQNRQTRIQNPVQHNLRSRRIQDVSSQRARAHRSTGFFPFGRVPERHATNPDYSYHLPD